MPQIVGKEIGPIGFGLMGMTWRKQPQSEEQSFKALRASLEAGANFWNAGEFYGTPDFNSLTLLNKYFTKYPEDAEKVVLSIKGGLVNMKPDGSPEGIKTSVENCLILLDGKKSIDIFECARVDKNTPIETTMKALEEFVKAGKIGGIALSEVSAASVRRAAEVTKIVAVEVELSLWSTDILSNGVAAACAEHNIPVIAYSPIGRGMLTGQIKSPDDIPEGDMRKTMPRFLPENFSKNLDLVKELESLAKQKGCTPAQLALAWTRSISKKNGNPEVIPIPGATTVERIFENSKDITLTSDELKAIESVLSSFSVAGQRYDSHGMAHVEG
ncbi:Pyridoxine 4-dehydrogenase [Cadophora gregata]|uniref:Pyridoxine 4-dehydrogenase n=1 Tax=Cadophora gregata TaxID=51156 RepID=UPI0026DC8D7E|nr:Pyridoxine 4-dehydrogenase [Cadophora gregata]KAK0104703.1 Pyridoxine 4-dehydrogenase [Cadophora gregata]KAK0115213.1 Pyridoxine 4-dehydrogenase [Cadophora gregata f. sp. sojae]